MRYDFHCDHCDADHEVSRPMANAGDPAPCPDCQAIMRRRYDTSTPVIFRPQGYSLRPDHPDYWKGFDDPLPKRPDHFKGVKSRTPRDTDDVHFSK